MLDIDWFNSSALVSAYFAVSQCLFLPSWHRMANELDGLNLEIKANLVRLCNKLDVVQTILGSPLKVTSMYRPPDYSPTVGGSSTDVHTKGMACDFYVEGLTIDSIKERLVPLLEGLDMRMEQGTDTWIHLDIRAPGPSGRNFKPIISEGQSH